MNDFNASRLSPERLYPGLFELVQTGQVFADSKTFVDAVPKRSPEAVMNAFHEARRQAGFDLTEFVASQFELPDAAALAHGRAGADNGARRAPPPVTEHIDKLWERLTRAADETTEFSSLIPLPHPYVVPGGRFREVYYWDSYFTLLGLAHSGRIDLVADMVANFAWLIDRIGFIPNGNRTYYCTRSQPPFFSLMVELLAEAADRPGLACRYQPQLLREYAFWMDGAETLTVGQSHRRVVAVEGGYLNRYWDDAATPRPESYAEDIGMAEGLDREPDTFFRDIRSAAESGWDFSSRWFADGRNMSSIQTTSVIPVDLNALLWHLESTIAANHAANGNRNDARLFYQRADRRRNLLRSRSYDAASGVFDDLLLPDLEPSGRLSLATAYPLFLGIATSQQATSVAARLESDFRESGGWVTTLVETGQQWDSPNGWAPLQWITYRGLTRYGFTEAAAAGARAWIDNNLAVYRSTGQLFEKYDAVVSGRAGGGGEYVVQDGFGWTNAVLLRLMHEVVAAP